MITLLLASLLSAPITTGGGQMKYTASGGASRNLADKLSDVVSAKDQGVLGSGDDSAHLASAISTAASQGRSLYVPAGTYSVKNVAVSAPITIECEGRTVTTFKLPALASLDGSPIFNVTVGGVTFRHCGFDGNKANQPADGFSDSWAGGANGQGRSYRAAVKVYSGTPGSVLSGVVFEDNFVQNTYGAGLATQDVSHVKARRNKGLNNNFETVLLYSDLSDPTCLPNQDVADNEVLNTGSGDPTIQGNAILLSHACHSTVTKNHIDTSERNFLKCEACTYTNTTNNVANNITTDNFPCISYQIEGTGSTIADNQCSNVGAGITLGYVTPGTGFNGIVIKGNTIDTTTGSTQGDAITVSGLAGGGSGITIADNVARNIKRYCTYFNGGAVSNIVVRGNNCKTTGLTTAGGFQYAVDTNGASNVQISGNVYDLGNAATSAGGVFFNQSAGATIANVSIVGNVVTTGAAHAAFADNANMITSGIFADNMTDGQASFASTNLLVSDTNAILSHNAWMAPGNGRTALTTPITATIYDTRIVVKLTTPGAVAITLPALGTDGSTRILAGHTLLIKDGTGDAGTNNITITRGASTTIDGLTTTKVINTNFGSLLLVYDGTNNWSTVQSFPNNKGTITLVAGSGTATVSSGCTPSCTDTTANASVKCAVATTTLTATGTGTDVIAYLCF